jgi:gliding motility-associated-like protein
LVVTSQSGQADAEVKVDYLTVYDLPNASFTTSGNGCTIPFDVTFTNTSDTGPGITYSWDFGNSQTSTQQNPTPITYSIIGSYTVSLVVTNAVTGCTNTVSQTIDVSDFSASFTMPTTGCVGSPIPFTDGSTVGANQWAWNFGDGNTSTSQNPSHAYVAAGTYTVTLTAQNTGSGCSDVITQSITINPLPMPSFTADITSGCAPLGVTFTNTSPGGGTYDWDFGNGSIFTGQNPPTEQYTSNGLYTVSLTMTDANGCASTFTTSNLIDVSAPVIQFSMDQYNGCEPLTVQFTDGSSSPNPIADPLATWLWDFGDGSPVSSGEVPPPHDYNEGIYSVTLTVITQSGCQASLTLTDTIQVGSIANVNFSVNPIIECAKTDIDFIDLTTFNGTPGAGEVSYSWNFGDGGLSSQQSPSHQYVDTGFFDVELIVEWRGCVDTFEMNNAIYIKAPVSIFNSQQVLYCNPASFPVNVGVVDNSLIGAIPDDAEMIWDWGDGTFTYFDDPDFDDADLGSTTHDYNNYGSYTIEQVIINHTTGCSDSTTVVIHISETTASFLVSNDSTCVGTPIDLTSISTSSHPFGTYTYDMGNGGSASGSPTVFTYNNFGQFDITHIAINSVGCADTAIIVDMNALALPQANITTTAVVGCAPILITNTNNSVVVGNGVGLDSFFWTHPDQSNETTNNVSTTTDYLYTTEGVFTTSMVVTDVFGCVSPVTSVNMTITKPSAAFVLDPVVCDLEAFTATNTSSGATSYEWFLDGSSISSLTDYSDSFDESTNSMTNSVVHNVQLIAEDANGCLDTLDQDIVVSMPRAEFDYTLTGANVNAQGEFTCPPVFASFTDISDSYGTITSHDWNFGDGKFSTLQDPNNTYVFSGTYSVSFSIIDEYGCTHDTILVDYLSISGPSGDPDWVDPGGICGQTFIFEATNLSNVSEIIWDMNNGQTISDTNLFTYTYPAYDTYYPTATLTDSLGCEVIYPLNPIAVLSSGLDAFFDPNPLEGPMGTTFIIDDLSAFTTSPIITWEWQFYDDTIVNFNNASIFQPYGLPGVYPISLVVTDSDGCFDTYSASVEVTDDFHLPNVITANGDGVNDLFTLPIALFKSFDIVIMNRWGNVIHQRNGATGTLLWDGMTENGNQVGDGTYFYKLTGTVITGETAAKDGFVQVFH